MFKKYLLVLLLTFFAFPVFAQENPVELLFFYSPTCPHCHEVEAELNTFKETYPQLDITEYNVTEEEGNKIFLQLSDIYEKNINGVPVVLINDKALSGSASSTINEIESQIEICSVSECESPSEKIAAHEYTDPQQQKAMYILVAVAIIATFLVIIFLFNGRSTTKS